MGLDKALDKTGQSGAGVEVHTDSGDEREQNVQVRDTPATVDEIKRTFADGQPEKED